MRQPQLYPTRATLNTVEHLCRTGRYVEALTALQPDLAHPDGMVRGAATLLAVACYRRTYQLTAALELIARQRPDLPPSFRPRLILERAGLVELKGQWEAALQAYLEYMSEYGPDSEGAGECFRGMAACAHHLGRHQESLFYAAKAVRLLRRQENPESLMAAYVEMSAALMAHGQAHRARRLLMRAHRLLQQAPRSHVRLRALISLTRWEYTHGSADRAAELLAEAWRCVDPDAPAQRWEYGWCLYLQARAHAAAGEREQAVAQIRTGLRVAAQAADTVELRRELVNLLRAVQV